MFDQKICFVMYLYFGDAVFHILFANLQVVLCFEFFTFGNYKEKMKKTTMKVQRSKRDLFFSRVLSVEVFFWKFVFGSLFFRKFVFS